MVDKRQQYNKLVQDVAEFYRSRREEREHNIYLEWCEDCHEINLWSYWQGSLDARIMVVGQDWGCPKGAEVIENIRAINNGTEKEYHIDPDSLTDKNLNTLLTSIGFPADTWNPELFFTNFALGYRNKGLTGGFKGKWLRECDPFFKRLVEIVEPEVIICLGQNTFRAVTRSLGKRVMIRGYNSFIEGKDNPVDCEGRLVFAEAHCGYFGTVNRARGSGKDGMDLQLEDWKKIGQTIRKCKMPYQFGTWCNSILVKERR